MRKYFIVLLLSVVQANAQSLLLTGISKPLTVEGNIKPVSFAGRSAIEFTLNSDDRVVGYSKRSELGMPFWQGKKVVDASFSTCVPVTSFSRDPNAIAIFQFHDMPDTALGETWRTPPVLMTIRDDSVRLVIMWSRERVNSFGVGETDCDGRVELNCGKVDRNVWTDWKLHVKFAWKKGGQLQLYKNGKLLHEFYGANCYYDDNYAVVKFGEYNWNPVETWKSKQLVIYFSNVVIN